MAQVAEGGEEEEGGAELKGGEMVNGTEGLAIGGRPLPVGSLSASRGRMGRP